MQLFVVARADRRSDYHCSRARRADRADLEQLEQRRSDRICRNGTVGHVTEDHRLQRRRHAEHKSRNNEEKRGLRIVADICHVGAAEVLGGEAELFIAEYDIDQHGYQLRRTRTERSYRCAANAERGRAEMTADEGIVEHAVDDKRLDR